MRHRVTVSRGLLLSLPFEELRDICPPVAGTTFRWAVPREYLVSDADFLLPIHIAQRVLPATIYNTFNRRAFIRVELSHDTYLRYRR